MLNDYSTISLYAFHKGWPNFFNKHGFEIVGLAGPGSDHEKVRKWGIKTIIAPLEREIKPLKDLYCLIWLWWHFLWNRYDIIHVGTPKASLLGAVAARLAFHRRIMSTQHGRVYENMAGRQRAFHQLLERITSKCTSLRYPVSKELGQHLVDEKLCPQSKIRNIGNGTCNGFDTSHFSPKAIPMDARSSFRKKFNIPDNAVTILFIGRVREDKGVNELYQAFKNLTFKTQGHLLIVGPTESASQLPEDLIDEMNRDPQVTFAGHQNDVRLAYAASDIFTLPSHREGFPLVPMEAACFELPTVTSNISGCREAVLDNHTGLLFEMGNAIDLADKLQVLIDNPALREKLGEAAKRRVIRDFQPEIIWNGILDLYNELLEDRN